MNLLSSRILLAIQKIYHVQVVIFVVILIVMGNLNALVDTVLHPEIPYFDEEHLIVGGVTIAVSGGLFGLLMLYFRSLSQAMNQIQKLEGILPICSNCKRIRAPNSDPKDMDSWQPVEKYLKEKTASELTHSICPECASMLYPEYHR
jgi:hypothetical protein